MMIIDNKFNIGDIVYLKTDMEQRERMVTCISIRPTGISYAISCDTEESWHYDIELSTVREY